MGNVVLMISMSLDGYIAGPDNELDWPVVDDELLQFFNDYLGTNSAFLEGRVVYELMNDYWPTAHEDPDASAVTLEYARIWQNMPKLVYSRTLERVGPNATIVRDVVPEEVNALKAASDGDLSVAGAVLAAAFARHDLIDEYRILVHPVLIGAGKPLFPLVDFDPTALELIDTRTFGSGVVMLHYRRAAEG
jgi:dihydrofolate reductase